jgi:LmbE family N-acetylglucosaminyl deacetylase
VRRLGGILAAAVMLTIVAAAPALAAPPSPYTADDAVKLDVLGEWAHPDDDTSIIGPCGVWHARYGTRCGIIMVTRGEGGGNAVGTEIGPALGLRRENEDRVAHYRSGTVDIFNLDRVDFFYNTTAPLTQHFWGENETLRRITRIIRMTQPEIYIGFTPSLAAGHGNHQQAGRYIWEGVKAAADPTMFPEQLTGPHALRTWQVKKIFSGGATTGTGGTTTAAHCTTGFLPAATNFSSAVAGVWTGYESPYKWPLGNLQGEPPGTAKTWAQVAMEGARAYPTQSRVMFQALQAPGCSRFGMTDSFVPFQPNANPDGTPNPAAGRDDAILYGATRRDPGGLPLGTLEYLTTSSFFNAPGTPFDVTVHVKSGEGTLPAGTVALTVPTGWTTDAAKPIGPIGPNNESTVTFSVTPAAGATVNTNYRVSALLSTGGNTGYTDTIVRVVPPVEGRFERWGKWEEYDNWITNTAPRALRIGLSPAAQSIGMGETRTVPVKVHNWSTTPQTGDVQLTLPAGFTADATSKPYGTLAPGADATVEFDLTNTDATLPDTQDKTIQITTTFAGGSASENLTMTVVPTTTVPPAAATPTLDAQESPGEYTGPALDVGKRWEGGDCAPVGVDCGSTGTIGDPATSTYAKVTHRDNSLYLFIHVRDDYQAYAVTPAECVAHWLADSVEILIDPRGNAMETLRETANTFKLGVFPYTNDPSAANGNGANGPCWSRDADNHQGYSTGPLAATVANAPNAPGVQVKSSATWVGDNQTTTDHSYTGGGYNLEVKIPFAALPAAPSEDHIGLNITPYDNDNTAASGTTTLRHIDNSARRAWSSAGSVQSNPYAWGHAVLAGYTPPAGQPTTPPDPIISSSNLNGVDSPQTVHQSAVDGVPIAGRDPAPDNNRITSASVNLRSNKAEVKLTANGSGRAHVFLWSGVEGYIPVWTTSCSPAADPPPDYGMTPCAVTDGATPAWSPDMSGRVVRDVVVNLTRATKLVNIPLTSAQAAKLARDGSALISFETPAGAVQALDLGLAKPRLWFTATRGAAEDDDHGARQQVLLSVDVTGTNEFPGTPTGTVRFQKDGRDISGPVALDADGHAELRVADPSGTLKRHVLRAVYSGDGDYVAATATLPRKPSSPQGGQRPGKIDVACRVVGKRTVRCVVKNAQKTQRVKAKLRLAGTHRVVTRSGEGRVRVTLKSRDTLTRKPRVVARVTRAGTTTRMVVRARRP